jgi:hypothetical protein
MLGDLLDVIVPGLILEGAIAIMAIATPVGPMIFSGPWMFTVLTVIAGVLVLGYIAAGLQSWIAHRYTAWLLPPDAHLAPNAAPIRVPARAVERAGFQAENDPVEVPHGHAYALERSLAGAWGVPEATWARAAFLQRVTVAFTLSALVAAFFLVGDVANGAGVTRGIRTHGSMVLGVGVLGALLVNRAAAWARRTAIVDLFADARAMVMDRGEHREVRRVLDAVGLEMEGEPGETLGVPP